MPVLALGELNTLQNFIDLPELQVCTAPSVVLHSQVAGFAIRVLLMPWRFCSCSSLQGVWLKCMFPAVRRKAWCLSQAWTYKKLGFPVPYLVVGRWGLTPFPKKTALRFVVGEPIAPPHVPLGGEVSPCRPLSILCMSHVPA